MRRLVSSGRTGTHCKKKHVTRCYCYRLRSLVEKNKNYNSHSNVKSLLKPIVVRPIEDYWSLVGPVIGFTRVPFRLFVRDVCRYIPVTTPRGFRRLPSGCYSQAGKVAINPDGRPRTVPHVVVTRLKANSELSKTALPRDVRKTENLIPISRSFM